MGLHKILRIVALILSLLGIAFLVMILVKGDETIEATGENVNGYMYIAYITLLITLFFTLLFSFTQLFTNPTSLKKTLLSVGAFVLIIVISYAISDGSAVEKNGVEVISADGAKWVSTGLRTFYFLAFIAVAAMVYSGIRKLIKS